MRLYGYITAGAFALIGTIGLLVALAFPTLRPQDAGRGPLGDASVVVIDISLACLGMSIAVGLLSAFVLWPRNNARLSAPSADVQPAARGD